MVTRSRTVVGVLCALACLHAQAVELAYEPVALGWSSAEVETATMGNITTIIERAERSSLLGCSRYCEGIERIFARLLVEARAQSARSNSLDWSLTVVRLPDLDALAMPGGQVVISEALIDRRAPTDEGLAFVIAHEMAHCILEHERQALTFARMLLPRNVQRSVSDIYAEMDFNFALLKAMEPAMQQGEFEADELGLLLASAAGYAPDRQIEFMEGDVAEDSGPAPLVATHPPASERLLKLRERLPLARRLVPASAD